MQSPNTTVNIEYLFILFMDVCVWVCVCVCVCVHIMMFLKGELSSISVFCQP